MANIWVLLFLVLVPVLAGMMLAFTWLSHVTVRRVIGQKHKALEEIHRMKRIPACWTRKYDAKLLSLERSGYEPDGSEAVKWSRRKQAKVAAELDKLIAYTRRTLLIEEEVRQTLLRDLEAVRASWQEQLS
ncbi:MAG: hypothetical protein K0Q59_5083 [Paenibacillus sp.]|jgi:hypothetical protein|nr:hypothetical protein [Paenibacillus sp.]